MKGPGDCTAGGSRAEAGLGLPEILAKTQLNKTLPRIYHTSVLP